MNRTSDTGAGPPPRRPGDTPETPLATTRRPERARLPGRAAWWTITLLAAATALLAARYLTLDPEVFLEEQRAAYLARLTPLLLHIGGGTAALLLGPWQFVARLRTRRPAAHRIVGRAYLVCVAATAAGGLLLVPGALVPPIAPIGFALLDVLLVLTTAAALHTARRRRFDRHRVWMVRSYALILSAVTLRLWLVSCAALGVPFDLAYASAAWTCWLINLLLAELALAHGFFGTAVGAEAGSVIGPAAVRVSADRPGARP
ncbi:DUF2306 domain-containing protein [Streptomyces sp. NPDC048606]|uniref:DUF2306 domain-containing protein n=1 Tax=Streptomyces sp. NPDC048606 TaxID=3154726 RepID=UPI00343DC0BA